MFQVLTKEIGSFLNSLIAYIVISVFLTGMGLLMWVFPETNVLDYGFADMGTLFSLGPYVFMFLIPAITMKMFAEERKTGTIELLLTRPLTDFQLIGGKFIAAWLLVTFALIPTLFYYFSLYYLGNPVGNIDSAGIAGSYIGLILLGGAFTAMGIFSTAITENQIVAFIIGVFLCFIFYSGFNSLSAINVWGKASLWLEQVGILYHYNAISRGLIDSRDVVYFFSLISLMLLSTNLVLGSRKW
ncbi:gliding motility-associated ABC transporter permease subunit GldF [Xanthovirga aplysinae]|uniref:gliding motility-associated ABC transporter permease subunit GldF n=1 Tax=Xanthovirga aplysinae TaxID=2529853 RepID=UPI0012BB9777|nr:gliding motility-associated ABC transporter permease subunit GldF [Xanthovirga aplysinae]MTI33616.1 gliding motility-associated ABC transporter permease subunit GldF [Xanthovirga aplysinae]